MGSGACTRGFSGELVGVQITPLGKVQSPRNAPISLKRGNVLPLLVLWRKTSLDKSWRCWKAVHSRWNASDRAKRIPMHFAIHLDLRLRKLHHADKTRLR